MNGDGEFWQTLELTPRQQRIADQRERPEPPDSWQIDRWQDDYEAAHLGWGRGQL